MRMTRRSSMAKTNESDPVFAGTGGVVLGEARTNHEGRKAILLVRDNENTAEFVALVARSESVV